MAERKRRGGQAAGGRHAGETGGSRRDEDVDKAVVDAEDGAVADDLDEVDAEDEDLDLTDAEDDEDEASADDSGSSRRSGGTATATRAKPKSSKPQDKKLTKEKDADRKNIFAMFFSWLIGLGPRLADFVREVVAELRKVIWPTRNELVTYTTVVVVFVVMMLTIVGLLDFGFAKGVLWVFGSGSGDSN